LAHAALPIETIRACNILIELDLLKDQPRRPDHALHEILRAEYPVSVTRAVMQPLPNLQKHRRARLPFVHSIQMMHALTS
jgi:hypothetical protein